MTASNAAAKLVPIKKSSARAHFVMQKVNALGFKKVLSRRALCKLRGLCKVLQSCVNLENFLNN